LATAPDTGAIRTSDAGPEHVATIKSLQDTTLQIHHERLPHVFSDTASGMSEMIDAAAASASYAKTKLLLRVALDGDTLVGYVLAFGMSGIHALGNTVFLQDNGTLMIADIHVIESHRGMGIGRRLLEDVQHRLPDLGCKSIAATVWRGNAASHALFTAAGYDAEQTVFRLGQPSPINPSATPRRWRKRLVWLVLLLLVGIVILAWAAH
jgi:GNAT superfamily N-acetyltransferase